MNNQEKRHRTSMQHLRYLNSFMDEIDREVMSLTDRAFKSLCIGDEAIYNDSEFSPSPVSCHKPKVEDLSSVKKLNSYPLNGATDLLSRPSKSSRKNGESVKMTNGDLWDKSTLLSIQRELSSGHHRLTEEHNSQGKHHLKADEESGKSLKSKHSKNTKLRKLNCINFFLHSEFSPFLSWRDFNKFSIGQEHISEILLNDRSPEWYDSPLYKELTAAHGHYKISSPTSVEKEGEQKETHSPEAVQSAAPVVPPKPDKEHINIPTKAPPLATEQRCNSERAEPCAPWRKSRSRAKSAAPVGHSIISSPSAQTFKKDVKTIEDQTSASSTPFSISQLLTPVIPSRHGTGTSEILLSPTSLEIPALPERELHPSPEIKREGYKSIASSLLFNLKDNRKRVKTMYSPPKFKGADAANQTKVSPQPEASKDGLAIRETSETVSPARHRAIITPMSPLLETADTQNCSPANDGVPDDYLGLSLLQSGKVKSNRSPAANKATYPSLHLYRKNSPEEISDRANSQTVVNTSSQVDTEPSKSVKGVELESSRPTLGLNRSSVSLANMDEETISEGANPVKDRCIINAQKSPVKEKAAAKHAFSARQNNYIKSQRFVSKDDDAEKGSLRVDDGRARPAKKAKDVEESNVSKHKVRPLLKERGEGLTDQSSGRRNNDTMKGNTSAKRALFASMEQGSSKTNAPLKKENVVMDKYDLAKLALEEVIAEREQRKLRNCIELPANIEKQLPIMGMQEAKGQNTAKTNWQTVETLPEDMAKHGESHVPEIKLARPCKQEASIGQCQHLEPIKYNERDRSCLDSRISSADKICKKKELINKNNVKKAAKRSESLESSDIRLVPQCEEELGVDQKPEVPPRRGRSNSQDSDRVGENTESKLVFRREGDTTVTTEDSESKEVSKVQSSQSKNRGPVRGNVTALKEKYDKESKKVLSAESTCSENSGKEGHAEKTPKDKMKHTFVTPKLTVSDPDSTIIYKEMDSESEIMSSSSKESDKAEKHSNSKRKRSITQKNPSDITSNRKEVVQDDKVKVNGKEGYAVLLKELEDKQNKSKHPTKSYVKDFLNGLLGLSNSDKVKIDCEEEPSETEPSFRTDKGRKDSITVYDILGKPHSACSMNGKPTLASSRSSNSSDFSLLHDSESGAQLEEFLRKTEEKILKEKVKENVQEPIVDSCSLSNHESESDISDRVVSPPSDVDKKGWVHSLIESARDFPPIPHSHGFSKDQQEIEISQKENEEADLEAPIPVIPIKSPPPSQPAMHFLSLPASHLAAVKERKLSAGSVSVSEEEERRSAVSTLSEGLDGYETSGGDPMEENISSTAPTEDAEGSKEPSERSASACSGNDNHGQNKPPVVPPKTEKALRRAMKLTTRRIQKAERKGRSSDKTVSQKADKAHDRSEHRSLSSDRIGGHLNDSRSEKHDRRRGDQKSQHVDENDPSKKLPHATKGEDQPTSQTGDSKRDHLENGNLSNDCERLGRSNEKHLPKKLDRRTQSLDRFLKDKRENISSAVGSELSTEGSQYSTPKALPLPHNSIEHTYAPASNLVTQSFPITQRKLLQDPDSGQYFLVDMPVQVKTKTFFDPETKSYVQLPVQSPEAAPPLEVMNTPPLMVFHGFVPVPVPSQKSVVRTQGSVIPLDDLEDFEPSRTQIQEDFCQTQNEPVYISQEHTPEEEIDSVR